MSSEGQDSDAAPLQRVEETSSHTALVVWGSTGRRVQFSLLDLKMPEHIKSYPNHRFYEQQWDSVSKFWYTRILKESALQNLTVSDIIQRVEGDIAKRWKRRRSEQATYKKSKRLLTGNHPAGSPSTGVLVTNVVGWSDYDRYEENDKKELMQAIVERVEDVTKSKAVSAHILVDEDDENARTRGCSADPIVPHMLPKRGVESSASHGSDDKAELELRFDDRVAVVCVLSSIQLAARAIAHIHRSKFDGRIVICRFAPMP